MEYTELDAMMQDESPDAQTQNLIGTCYYRGRYTLQNQETAVSWFRKAAQQGDEEALCQLGRAYFEGAGVAKDYEMAYRYFSQGKWEISKAERYKCFYDEDGNIRISSDFQDFPGLEDAVRRESVTAFTAMGNCYYMGHGTAVDYETAVKWYQKAAQKDEVEAIWALGCCYCTGTGVPCDFEKGFQLFQKAAEQEFLPALYNLSKCYAYGCGTEKDEELSEHYRKQADRLKIYKVYRDRFYTPFDYHRECKAYILKAILKTTEEDREETHKKL